MRDTDGKLRVMYQGSTEEFTVFDKKKSKPSNLYGRGFYFTDSKVHASQYGNARAYYLNITNPLSNTENSISKSQLTKFVAEIAENEDYGIENYGYDATVKSVVDSVWGKSDFAMLQDISATCIGDLVAATKLFNEINGTSYDGFILDTETVTFDSNQAKLTTNESPTVNEDMRFSARQEDAYSAEEILTGLDADKVEGIDNATRELLKSYQRRAKKAESYRKQINQLQQELEEAKRQMQTSCEPIHPTSPARYMKKFAERNGIRHLHPHKLRHSFASVAIVNGADIASVSEKLGHADKGTTLRLYTHADENSIRAASNIFREAISQA